MAPVKSNTASAVKPPRDVPKSLKSSERSPSRLSNTTRPARSAMRRCRPSLPTFTPGERFFDHFDLVTWRTSTSTPDGRDLGENYTYTSWMMSPCIKSASSVACTVTPRAVATVQRGKGCQQRLHACHKQRVENATTHTHHQEGALGINDFMPYAMTSFARMNRSDHSMLPPTPSATISYKSPMPATSAHTDKDAAWADKYVREWRPRDYQAPVLKRAALIEAGRKRD